MAAYATHNNNNNNNEHVDLCVRGTPPTRGCKDNESQATLHSELSDGGRPAGGKGIHIAGHAVIPPFVALLHGREVKVSLPAVCDDRGGKDSRALNEGGVVFVPRDGGGRNAVWGCAAKRDGVPS